VVLGEDLISFGVLCNECKLLYSGWKLENLDAMNGGVVGVFIAPTTKLDRWWRLSVRWRTGHVRCDSHVTKIRWGRPLELCLLGPPGCPVAHWTCTVDCPVRQYGRA
jgi:hypothetical protein